MREIKGRVIVSIDADALATDHLIGTELLSNNRIFNGTSYFIADEFRSNLVGFQVAARVAEAAAKLFDENMDRFKKILDKM